MAWPIHTWQPHSICLKIMPWHWHKRSMKRKMFGETENDKKEAIEPERAHKKTIERAVRLLAAKARSTGELKERLLEKSWTNEEIVDAVIAKLNEYDLLDDARFAADLAFSKLRQRPQGKRRLAEALSKKHLSQEIAAEAIRLAYEEMPETELIDAAIEKRLRSKGIPITPADRKKFCNHLLRRGFSFGLIQEKLTLLAKTYRKTETCGTTGGTSEEPFEEPFAGNREPSKDENHKIT